MNLRPFKIDIPEREIFELKQRLSATRLPEKETVDDWSQGVPRAYLAELCSYWVDIMTGMRHKADSIELIKASFVSKALICTTLK